MKRRRRAAERRALKGSRRDFFKAQAAPVPPIRTETGEPMAKHTDDPAARDAARDLLALENASNPAENVAAFPTAEFEIAAKTIDGESVVLRRVVLVGPWQVVTK